MTVRLAVGDPDTVEIRFLDVEGRDLDPSMQRKVERLLSREDYRRAFGGEIGDIEYPPRSLEFYTAALERVVDIDAMQQRRFKIVLDYCFGAVSIVMPNLLTKLGAEVLAVNPFASTASATVRSTVPDPGRAHRRAGAGVGQRRRVRDRSRRRARHGGRRHGPRARA